MTTETPQDPAEIRRRRNEAIVFAMILLAFAWFQRPVLYDNALSRLDLTYSLVLNHTINIDSYHENTMDKALFRNHYYCDKAPGLSVAAAPVLFLAKSAFRSVSFYPGNPLAAWMLILIVVSMPSALAFMLLFRILRREAGERAAAAAVLSLALGSLCATYSGLFYGHAFAGALLVFALYPIVISIQDRDRPSLWTLAWCGLLLGCSLACEYTALMPALAVAGLALYAGGWRRALPLMAAGAAIPIFLLGMYNNAAFGSPFSLGYFHEVAPLFNKEMNQGLGGVSWPRAGAALALLGSPQRGVLWLSPALVFAVHGFVRGWRAGGHQRILSAAALFAFASLFAVNAGYFEPFGGHTPGPRFLVSALPFLAILLAFSFRALGPAMKTVFLALSCFSVFHLMAFNAGDPHAPLFFKYPLFDFVMPMMRQGYVSNSLGLLFGAGHMASLGILLILLTLSAVLLCRNMDPRPRLLKPASAAAGGVILFALFLAYGARIHQSIAHTPGAAREYSQAWARRGYSEYHQGRFRSMQRSLLMAMDNDPQNLQPYVSLAAFYIHVAGQPHRALPVLLQARDIAQAKRDPLLPVIMDLLRAADPPPGQTL